MVLHLRRTGNPQRAGYFSLGKSHDNGKAIHWPKSLFYLFKLVKV